MDKNNKEYIVTKIEKYDEMYDNDENPWKSIAKSVINGICLIIFKILYNTHFQVVPGDSNIVANQVFHDAFMLGIGITECNNLNYIIQGVYSAITIGKELKNKLQKNDIENQTEIMIENKEGKTR